MIFPSFFAVFREKRALCACKQFVFDRNYFFTAVGSPFSIEIDCLHLQKVNFVKK